MVFTKGVHPLLLAKEQSTLMMLGGEHWAIGISGGILYAGEKKGLSRPKKTEHRDALFYHHSTMMNMYLCLKIEADLQGALHRMPFTEQSAFSRKNICHPQTVTRIKT